MRREQQATQMKELQ